ncbi:MAG: hypothetical protein M1818_004237 [Claussenomyces sp. TS43310]|nr:MAG: hypothetical protein M1818_004237 [Claussenomyces sp. TS43310]
MSIFPYIYFMVESFQITQDKTKISVYAGMVTSAFTIAEFSTGLLWGKLSDRIGRKPVLLTGLAGTGLSMIIFGFAPSLPVALLARALGGLLNGNIGVLQTTVAELVTVKEHQPRAYTIMPFVWCLGSILGPSLGGALAQPSVSYPSLFRPGSIFERFPFLLPNLVCTIIVVLGVVIGILFLEETHAERKNHHDAGLAAGRWLLGKVQRCRASPKPPRLEKSETLFEVQSLIDEDEGLPGYRTTEASPTLPTTTLAEPLEGLSLSDDICESSRPKPAATKAFTRPVVLNIIGYGILAYHTISFDSMLPVFLSTPDSGLASSLPFQFVGGFGLSTKQIGFILSMQGIYSMIATALFFPIVVRKLGPLNLFRLLALSYPLLYFTTPYLILLPASLRTVGIYAIIIWKCTFSNFAYPANAILLTNSAPSLLLLGTINGFAASAASLNRAIGPTVSGFLYTLGLRLGYSGLAWWVTGLIAIVGGLISTQMEENGGRMDEKMDEDEEAYPIDCTS